MTRRSLLAAGMAAVLDPDRLLWRAGAKLISIPAPPPIEPCPFVIVPNFAPPWIFTPAAEADRQVTAVLQGLLEHRWNTDADFRRRADYWTVQDFILHTRIDASLQVGRGYFKGVHDAFTMTR